jgi:YHS domain-containing protein
MIRFLIVRFLFPLLLFLLLRAALRSIFTTRRTGIPRAGAQRSAPPVETSGELKKDPVCGTYVSTSASVTRTVDGKLIHFCSKECRDKYRIA